MAATLTEEYRIPIGQSHALCFGTVTMDSSYATSGEAIDAIGDTGYEKVFFEQGTVVLSWDKVNQKVFATWGNAGSASVLPEVTSTTDLSAVVQDYIALAIQ
jgi:hypothetical protein